MLHIENANLYVSKRNLGIPTTITNVVNQILSISNEVSQVNLHSLNSKNTNYNANTIFNASQYNQSYVMNGINGPVINGIGSCFQQSMEKKMFFQINLFDPYRNRNKNNDSKPHAKLVEELGTLLDHVGTCLINHFLLLPIKKGKLLLISLLMHQTYHSINPYSFTLNNGTFLNKHFSILNISLKIHLNLSIKFLIFSLSLKTHLINLQLT